MRVLFIGAHPDDIEIGAGALARRLVRRGSEVWFLILTAHPVDGPRRAVEAKAAAQQLGVSRVVFLDEIDGRLDATAPTVARMRELLQQERFLPDVIVAHSEADSHNDHRAANSLARAAFRQCVQLFYSIHVSAEVSEFTPQFFVQLSADEAEAKRSALVEHGSQKGTIERSDLSAYECSLGELAGVERAEAFEVEFQAGAQEGILRDVLESNDSAFHRLWSRFLGPQTIYLLHEDFDSTYPIDSNESLGREALRDAFVQKWVSYPRKKLPLVERFANAPEGGSLLEGEHALLAGGSVSNSLYRSRFIRTQGVDWVVEYEIPTGPTAFLLQRSTGKVLLPLLDARGGLESDLAVFTLMRSPHVHGKWLLSCAGAHGTGTRALLEFLADPGLCPDLLDWVMATSLGSGGQALTRVNGHSREISMEAVFDLAVRSWEGLRRK